MKKNLKSRSFVLITVVVCVALAVIGTILAVVLATRSQRTGSSQLQRPDKQETKGLKQILHLDDSEDGEEEDSTDPTTQNYTMTALAIGDWGRTVAKLGGSCCARRKTYSAKDFNAMEYTSTLLGLAAAKLQPRPQFILGHGDNFYWMGLESVQDQAYRFQETFESKYQDASLRGIPWINVLGNHDYGGASFVCSKGNLPMRCGSAEALVDALNQKFSLQASYRSPNEDRWVLKDHFYTMKYSVGEFEVEIFNLETNDADTHGARQICCQCYGYAGKDDPLCDHVVRGDALCAGGNTAMYDACIKQLSTWAEDSREQLKIAVKDSKATWKIINTHYSPYNHYNPKMADQWKDLLAEFKGQVQLFIYGHTHAEKHDYASFRMHFIENGAGGGIQNESPSGIPPYAEDYVVNIWSAGHYPYGIFQLKFSETWMQVEFLTFDNAWKMEIDLQKSVIGGIAAPHCWYIPVSGRKGRKCVLSDK